MYIISICQRDIIISLIEKDAGLFKTINLETRMTFIYSDFSCPDAAVVVVEVEFLSSAFEATGHMLLRPPFRADIGHPVAAALGGSPAP